MGSVAIILGSAAAMADAMRRSQNGSRAASAAKWQAGSRAESGTHMGANYTILHIARHYTRRAPGIPARFPGSSAFPSVLTLLRFKLFARRAGAAR